MTDGSEAPIEQLRAVCLALPEVIERPPSWHLCAIQAVLS